MAASTIFFNGRVISVPGSYSQVDASGLEQVGLTASGIVAVLGTAEGGRPASSMLEAKDFIHVNKPSKSAQFFRSGDLREVTDMLFAPSTDAAIPGGAADVVAMKVNPSTQSTATLSNAQGAALDLTSDDYGAFTEQLNVSVGTGTLQGKLLTITFEDTTESVDNLGGDPVVNVSYVKPTNGWDAVSVQVLAGGAIKAAGSRAVAGRSTDFSGAQLAANHLLEYLSSNALDTGTVTAYGLDGAGLPIKETVTLNGTTAVAGALTFSKVAGIRYAGSYIATVQIAAAGAVVSTVAANSTVGVAAGVAMYANGVVTLAADGSSTAAVLVEGKSNSGGVILEKIALNGLTPVAGLANFSEVTALHLGIVLAARTVTASAEVARALPTVQKTMQKVADYFNARAVPGVGGFAVSLSVPGTFLPSNLDVMPAAVSCLSPANPSLYADLYAMVAWINQNSQLVSAAFHTGAVGGAVSNTASPVFLTGGGEGTTQFSHWQNALNLLKKVRVNSIVVLTPDPAVHAALDAHCAYMGGIGRSERDGFVGLMNAGMTDVASKQEIQTQIQALGSRHLRAYAQAIERYDSTGARTEFKPMFQAALAAGMQAGTSVGEPLTFKYMNCLSFRQHASWNPTDDSEEMIQSGLSFLEQVDGVGRRIVRNVTTYLASTNLAYVEGSVNQAVNYATFNFRTGMESAVGKKGFGGTINAAKGVAVGELGLLMDAGVLVAWRSLDIELAVDVLEVGVEVAPVLPINFVKNTIHLVTIRQSAAA